MKKNTGIQKAQEAARPRPHPAAPVQTPEVERPALPLQLASAERLGHRLSAVEVRRPIHADAPVQRAAQTKPEKEEEEENQVGQRKPASEPASVSSEKPVPNNTGLPDPLKAGIEAISGLAMDDVRVHFNSDKPAQLQALAYTQGTDIHIGPGQDQHLPHEAWHVVQQRQGRVQPTMQMEGNVNINDDVALEKEADRLGDKANRFTDNSLNSQQNTIFSATGNSPNTVVQTKRVTTTWIGTFDGNEIRDILDTSQNRSGASNVAGHPRSEHVGTESKAEQLANEAKGTKSCFANDSAQNKAVTTALNTDYAQGELETFDRSNINPPHRIKISGVATGGCNGYVSVWDEAKGRATRARTRNITQMTLIVDKFANGALLGKPDIHIQTAYPVDG